MLQQNPVRRALQHLQQKTIQIEFIPDQIKRQKANVATKGKQPLAAKEIEDTESDDSEDSD